MRAVVLLDRWLIVVLLESRKSSPAVILRPSPSLFIPEMLPCVRCEQPWVILREHASTHGMLGSDPEIVESQDIEV